MSTSIVNGAFVGLIYGLIAMGLVVVYRGSRVVSFAHGETGMIGAFLFAELWVGHRVPMALALVAGIGASVAIGAATERVVVRPLRDRPQLNVMVATVGLAALLIVFARRRYGVQPKLLPPLLTHGSTHVAGVRVSPTQVLVLGVSLVILASLIALYRGTSLGLRMRAAAMDPTAAAHLGVNVNTVSLTSWMIAGGLAGISAILIAPLVIFNVFFMTALLIRGLAAALLGGLTNVTGAFVAGVVLGVAEGALGFEVSTPGFVEFAVAILIIAVLLFRPTGLLGTEY